MSSDNPANIGELLDQDYQSYIIDVMKEWCSEKSSKKSSLRADLVEQEISKPLQAWIKERSDEEFPHFNGLEAAHDLVIKANDIIYILRYQTRPLYLEHISLLNDAWAQFQRSIIGGLYYHNRMLEQTLDVTLKNQHSIESAVAEELLRRKEKETQDREKRNQERLIKWQASGVTAWKYTEDDRKKWRAAGGVLLKENRHINSVRKLAEGIREKLGYPFGTEETIRKDKFIINIIKEHCLKKNIG